MGIGVFKAVEAHQVQVLLGHFPAFGLSNAPVLEAQLHVFHGGLPLVNAGLLEDHGDALVRAGDLFSVQLDDAGGGLHQARDDVKERRFAALAGAKEDQELVFPNVDGDIFNSVRVSLVREERFCDVIDFQHYFLFHGHSHLSKKSKP